MRSSLARLAVLGAFAVTMTACSGGSGNALPFAGPPNNAGGTPGTLQSGSNGEALIRFINGAPDVPSVDVCIDNVPFGTPFTARTYASASPLFAVAGGIQHTIAVYTAMTGSNAAAECATAPGPYFGASALAVSVLGVGNNVRWSVVFAGPSGSRALYVFNDPVFATAPGSPEAISHNAAPVFSTGKPNGVGFGQCTTTVAPCATPVALAGAAGVALAKPSTSSAAVTNTPVLSGINSVPAGFYDGIGVATGTPVPITSIPTPTAAGQPPVVQLYAIDAPAGGLNLVGLVEQTTGYGF